MVDYYCSFHSAPSGVPLSVATSKTTRSISATWDPIPCIERNGVIINYAVAFGPFGDEAVKTAALNRMFMVHGLVPFTNYSFRVAGVTNAGIGVFTAAEIITTNEEGI